MEAAMAAEGAALVQGQGLRLAVVAALLASALEWAPAQESVA
jgi:hypothetical protein